MCAVASGEPLWRNPITGIVGCCARAGSGHAAAPTTTDMNSRRLIAAPEAPTGRNLGCFLASVNPYNEHLSGGASARARRTFQLERWSGRYRRLSTVKLSQQSDQRESLRNL